jgi:2-C-methyl-D-erythritol 4-phosphate cytidylyltransferase
VVGGAPAAVPAVEVTETVKQLDAAGRVESTVARESLLQLQAPRAVRRSLLDAAHAHCAPADLATDEIALVPPGTPLTTVTGDHDAFPIVRAADLALAGAVLARRHAANVDPDPDSIES